MSRKHKLEACKKRKILKGTQYVIKEDLTQTNQNFLNELYNAPNINLNISDIRKGVINLQYMKQETIKTHLTKVKYLINTN
jgi:anaerobic ribonucleoside-triphosphate reductase